MTDSIHDLEPTRPLVTAGEYPVIAAVQAHWESLRKGRLAPSRGEIDPRPLAACLSMLFVAEIVAPGVARLRLCGHTLNDLLGMEPRGMPLSVFFEAEARDEVTSALRQVADGARVTLPLTSRRAFARPTIDARMMLLPLTDSAGKINRVLGVLETLGPIGRAPRRFTAGAPLVAAAPPATPEPETPRPASPRLVRRAPAHPMKPRPSGGTRPTLRVIEGGLSRDTA